VMIAVGIVLYYTSRGSRQSSALESLLPNGRHKRGVSG
jgi:hypothetical protein